MKLEAKSNCPLNNFEPCKQLDCAWFIKLRGTNPNTGEEVDEWGCAMAWQPILQIEAANQQRQTGAAVESLRNEVAKQTLLEEQERHRGDTKIQVIKQIDG